MIDDELDQWSLFCEKLKGLRTRISSLGVDQVNSEETREQMLRRFYETLNGKFETFVGPGHWFEQDDRCMRLGFGWPTPKELEAGLANISASIRAAQS